MKNIVVLGAGRSSASLIQYLLENSKVQNWKITVGDYDLSAAEQKVEGFDNATAILFDVKDENNRASIIKDSDLVISMVPAMFHPLIAQDCVQFGKHLVTASYVSDEMKALDQEAKDKGILLLNECGLDPGIDHMSAMKVIDSIREKGYVLKTFETFTGGLLAPTQDPNPWEYKFTWNPRNVVLAGQGTVQFLQEGKYKFIPYHNLFKRSELINIPGHGYFEGYANRDSLKYLDVYGLRGINTLYRGTLRRPGFCSAWDIFVQVGATEDSYQMENVSEMTHRDFINSFLSYNPNDSVELKLAHYLNLNLEGPEMLRLKWLSIFSEELVGLDEGTPAQILEHILKKKWTLNADDKDMIVMWHKFEYEAHEKLETLYATIITTGNNAEETAMAKTVGLPLAIAAKNILNGKIASTGVQVPIVKEIYTPILEELKQLGIEIQEDALV